MKEGQGYTPCPLLPNAEAMRLHERAERSLTI